MRQRGSVCTGVGRIRGREVRRRGVQPIPGGEDGRIREGDNEGRGQEEEDLCDGHQLFVTACRNRRTIVFQLMAVTKESRTSAKVSAPTRARPTTVGSLYTP